MDHITEEHIERFVRYPETLSGKEKEMIASAISDNPELREMADWFAEFYKELDSLDDKKVRKSIIPLFPLEKKGIQSNAQPLVFAAMSTAPQKSSVETVATLASEEDRTVARILRNIERNQYKIHLIRREQPSEHERTIFSIENLNMDLVIDESRHLSFEAKTELNELDWQQASYSLRVPLGDSTIDKSDLRDGVLEKTETVEGRPVSIFWEEGILKITIDLSAESKQEISRLIISDTTSSRLIRLNGETEYSMPLKNLESLFIQFYG